MVLGQLTQQLNVQPLINHPKKPDARVRNPGLVGGLSQRPTGLAKVGLVDAAGEGVGIGVLRALGFVQRLAPGKHEVGQLKQRLFAAFQLWVRKFEVGQLVHAVVHRQHGAEVARLAQRHGRVVPKNVVGDGLRLEKLAQQLKLCLVGGGLVGEQALGQVRHHHLEPVLALFHFEVRLNKVVVVVKRVLYVKHPAVLGKARQQVLGPLPHKIPVQMREANEVGQGGRIIFFGSSCAGPGSGSGGTQRHFHRRRRRHRKRQEGWVSRRADVTRDTTAGALASLYDAARGKDIAQLIFAKQLTH